MPFISLPSLDDCFYARKGVEMWRSGSVFAVTWNGERTAQHPPLQFWILARSFALFGENDFAARLPSVLMALGVLVFAYRIGIRSVGEPAALCGVSLLLLSTTFIRNARGCMMDVPLTFWISMAVLVLIVGMERPRVQWLLAVPIAAGVLTKSVLGLMPLLVLAACLASRTLRSRVFTYRTAIATVIGVALGASWTIYLAVAHGSGGVGEHYITEVIRRSTQNASPVVNFFLEYPRLLLVHFQPVIVPGLVGAVLLYRRWLFGRAPDAALAVVAWIAVPLALYNFSSARSSRYLFPILVPLSLCAGAVLASRRPRVAGALARWIVPALLVASAAVHWVAPGLLSRDANREFKQRSAAIGAAIPEDCETPCLGEFSWELASPFLYYGHRSVGVCDVRADTIVPLALAGPTRALLCERARLGELSRFGVEVEEVARLRKWSLVRLKLRNG